MSATRKAPSGNVQKKGGISTYPSVRKTARPSKMMREVGPVGMRRR